MLESMKYMVAIAALLLCACIDERYAGQIVLKIDEAALGSDLSLATYVPALPHLPRGARRWHV